MDSRNILCFLAVGGVSVLAFGQALPVTPRGEGPDIAAGSIRPADAPVDKAAALRLFDRARTSYDLRTSGRAYDLKVSFTVDSGGQTRYDGAWQMEDIYDPQQGLRWTATLPGSYSITRIHSRQMLYGEETDSYVPLRLHEVRAALFDPLPAGNQFHGLIRTADLASNGQHLTCMLFSGGVDSGDAGSGRHWNEAEDCVDPESGLLRLHSQVPGRYYAYDYSNAIQLGNRIVPRKVTVHEAGRIVTTISVDNLTELTAADPSLFVPTQEMKARGRPIRMGPAERLFRVSTAASAAHGPQAGVVCVFGVVNASGQLVEAHSLQPSDPNSQAAVEAAQKMSFSRPGLPGAIPKQFFVFVIRKFVPSP